MIPVNKGPKLRQIGQSAVQYLFGQEILDREKLTVGLVDPLQFFDVPALDSSAHRIIQRLFSRHNRLQFPKEGDSGDTPEKPAGRNRQTLGAPSAAMIVPARDTSKQTEDKAIPDTRVAREPALELSERPPPWGARYRSPV